MFDMKNRVVLITGAGPNIGQAIVRVFAEAGAAVICADARPEQAAAAAKIAQDAGAKAIAVPVDISKADEVKAMVEAGEKAFGTVDTLINNAAITINKNILNVTLDEWRRVIDVNLTGTFNCCKAVAERLVAAKKKGVIVNVASTSGHRGRAGAIAYCSSKGGVLNFTRALAIELAPHGIRVCSVSPTRTGASVGQQFAAGIRTAHEIPLGRLGNPEDHAYAMLFLASDKAQFITGQDLCVDGGSLATWYVSA